ncbi:hypothetical protein CPB85DRAFT_1433076 [Mucidula mucida]|nr:hypothetical protein CPB85DRAFT_1433076 [Mucidula mucida]
MASFVFNISVGKAPTSRGPPSRGNAAPPRSVGAVVGQGPLINPNSAGMSLHHHCLARRSYCERLADCLLGKPVRKRRKDNTCIFMGASSFQDSQSYHPRSMTLDRLNGKHCFTCPVEDCNVRFFIPNVNDTLKAPPQVNLQGNTGNPYTPEPSTSASRRRRRSPSPIEEVTDLTEDEVPSLPPRKRVRTALPTPPPSSPSNLPALFLMERSR